MDDFPETGDYEVEQVESNICCEWVEVGPAGSMFLFHFAPESAGEVDPKWDVAKHFALDVEGLGKAIFWVGVLPHFATIVE